MRLTRAIAVPARPRVGTALVAVVLVAVVLVALAAPGAYGHAAGDGVRYRLTNVSPQVDGVTIQVVRGLAGQLVVANDTDQVVEVLDDTGRAFLRIGPDGVEGDVSSPTWQASDRPFGLGGGDPGQLARAEPQWVRLSGDPSWGWYDHRLHQQELIVPPEATGPMVLADWTVPMQVDGAPLTVTGQTVGGPPNGVVVARLVSGNQVGGAARVTLLPGQASGLLLEVDDGHEALVRGEVGEPFLRFADGVVEVNGASPTWHRIGGSEASPVQVDATSPPTWRIVAQTQRYGWIEPRAAAPEIAEDLPEDQAVLATWAVPVEVDGTPETIVGELRWTALSGHDDDGGWPWLNLGLAATGVAAIAGLVVVRRRSRARRA